MQSYTTLHIFLFSGEEYSTEYMSIYAAPGSVIQVSESVNLEDSLVACVCVLQVGEFKSTCRISL